MCTAGTVACPHCPHQQPERGFLSGQDCLRAACSITKALGDGCFLINSAPQTPCCDYDSVCRQTVSARDLTQRPMLTMESASYMQPTPQAGNLGRPWMVRSGRAANMRDRCTMVFPLSTSVFLFGCSSAFPCAKYGIPCQGTVDSRTLTPPEQATDHMRRSQNVPY